jgi:RNA polymerase sigma-70 factor, ECF subfamily
MAAPISLMEGKSKLPTDAELTALYEQYGHLLHRRCLALLRNPADANDALQDTFIRVQRYWGSKGTGSTLSWLYRIAANCCLDIARTKGRETPGDGKPLEEEVRVSGRISDADRRGLLALVLRKLDAKTAEIGILYHLDGYTHEDIASKAGCSRKTVGRKLKDFEDRFRQFWLEAGGEI